MEAQELNTTNISPTVKIGEWVITKDGITYNKFDYWIDASRLDEEDWVEHVSQKTWCTWDMKVQLIQAIDLCKYINQRYP
jgi:hypothetical protein